MATPILFSVPSRHNCMIMRVLILSLAAASPAFFCEAFTLTSLSNRCQRCNSVPNHLKEDQISLVDDEPQKSPTTTRRQIISLGTALFGSIALAPPSYAGEVGARITKAVTTSDLGVSVRRSVVKGAQVIDKLDGKWEKFSDDNGLGSERFKQQGRPKPREVPDLKPLNVEMAKQILSISDDAFLSSTGVAADVLSSQIKTSDALVRKSFERSGLDLSSGEMTAPAFNYYCYVHFKSYCDILINNKLAFNRKLFEGALGEKLLPLFVPSTEATLESLATKQNNLSPASKEALTNGITTGLKFTDEIMNNLVFNGFVALAECNEIDSETLNDWTEDLTSIELSIPLDADVTLGSQMLLQEQGFRVYPDFGRFIITSALQKSFKSTNQNISSDEYYMDTNYSSDPDLFEVKQVLLNIVIDSS